MTETAAGQSDAIASGQVDFTLNFAAPLVVTMDAGGPITVLAGVHPGCFELFGNENIRGIRDLKGKSVGVQALGSSPHVFLTGMAAYVGLDPVKDINWVTSPEHQTNDALRPKGRSMRSSAFRLSLKSCTPKHRSRSHQQRRRSPLVAILLLHAGRQHRLRSEQPDQRPSASCAPFSRRQTFVSLSRSASHDRSSMTDSRPTMTMPCRR